MRKAILAALAALVFSVSAWAQTAAESASPVTPSSTPVTAASPAVIVAPRKRAPKPTRADCINGYGKVTVDDSPQQQYIVTTTSTVGGAMFKVVNKFKNKEITYDEFKSEMSTLVTSPKLINCPSLYSVTVLKDEAKTTYSREQAPVALYMDRMSGKFVDAAVPYYELKTSLTNAKLAAEWFMDNGFDPTIRHTVPVYNYYHEITPYELYRERVIERSGHKYWTDDMIKFLSDLADIFKHEPLPARKLCSEVDKDYTHKRRKVQLHEHCILHENVQTSRAQRYGNDIEKRNMGGREYRYLADKELSGSGLFPGWTSKITFTCSPSSSGCGYADYVMPENFTPEAIKQWTPFYEERYGLNVFCGESADLLGLDRDLEPGESVSVTQSSDTERNYPDYYDCRATALEPFTLSIQTTRLAK